MAPRARRAAKEHHVDLTTLSPTGKGGRIRERDVLAAANTPSTAAPILTPAAMKEVSITPTRRTIAARLMHSRQTTVPVTITCRCDATQLVTLRRQLKAEGAAQELKGKAQGTVGDAKSAVKSATDNSTSNVLMCDRNYVITYVNKAAQEKLKGLESEIRKVIPSFSADKIVGTCIDSFHKAPDMQRRLLDNPKNLPHKADIQLGPLTLELNVGAILSEKGEYLGNSLEWADVTEKRRLDTEMARIKTALDNTSTNVMVCDRTYTIVYVNKASVNTLTRRQDEIRKVFQNFDVSKVVGSCIDGYHKNPAHQRQLLDNPKNLPYRSEIKVGSLTLDLNAAAIMTEEALKP